MKIYHNPKCSKSRNALDYLQNSDKKFQIIEYLKNPPTKEELQDILNKLNMEPKELLRKGDVVKEYDIDNLTQNETMMLMLEFPQFIERPIIVSKSTASIARPLDNLINMIKK